MRKGGDKAFTLIELMIVIAIIAILAAILVPNFIRARANGQLTACKSNLKSLATALEVYSAEHGSRYPANLDTLTPDYVKTIGTCPAVGSDTYTAGFTSASDPDIFTIVCAGLNHNVLNIPNDFPQWTSIRGLVERP